MDLPMCLWEKVRNTIVYILNWCFDTILKYKTPEEALIGEKVEVLHFCVFVFPIYIRAHDEKRTKIEPSNIKSIFVGYSETSKAYKIYIPT